MTKQLSPLRRKDHRAGYQAAVKDIVAWLRDDNSMMRDYRTALGNVIEAKFGGRND